MQPPTSPPPPANEPKQARPRLRPPAAVSWLIAILLLLLVVVASQWYAQDQAEIPYTFFHQQLQARNIKSLQVRGQQAYGEFVEPPLAPAVEGAAGTRILHQGAAAEAASATPQKIRCSSTQRGRR